MKLLLISLGCDKNLVDSEQMLGLLSQGGHEIVVNEEEAEGVIINTCCFIGDAKEESVQTILEMADLKKSGKIRFLGVTGCMAQRYQDEILKEIPEVDAVLGTSSYDEILEAVDKCCSGDTYSCFHDISRLVPDGGTRIVTTGGHFAYIKVAEGCDKHCTYCIIPSLRGSYRSVPMEELVSQAEKLAARGVKELILVAQETTVYGRDLYGRKELPELLRRLCRIRGFRWIRILYCYPEEISDELIQVMKEEPKICHYLDMPVQHASNRILKRMGRHTTKEELTGIVTKLREQIPDIILRTTLISGFPGETEEEHAELVDFVDRMEFDRLGVFTYSPEEGTPAAGMDDQIPEDVKEARRDEIMELQQAVSAAKGQDMIGREVLCMVEGQISGESAYIARTYADAPQVDGYIFIQSGEQLVTGDFVKVKVTGALEYDLIGEIADEYAE